MGREVSRGQRDPKMQSENDDLWLVYIEALVDKEILEKYNEDCGLASMVQGTWCAVRPEE